MKITVYQIVPELDNDHLTFRGLSFIKTASDNKVPAEIYEAVYSGELEIDSPDDAFVIFNTVFPEGYKGRSMSVSDVVEMAHSSDDSRFYFCDSPCGFPEIEFEKARAMLPIANHDFRQEETIHCGNFHAAVCDGLGIQILWCSKIVLTRCRYSQCQLGYKLTYWNFGEDRKREKEFPDRPKVLLAHTGFCAIPDSVLYEHTEDGMRKTKYGSCSDGNFTAIETWCKEHHIEYKYL